MAFQNKLSDALNISLDIDHITGKPVVAIEFKFIHYRLIVDDRERAEDLVKALMRVLEPEEKKVDKPKLPKFYMRGKGSAP